MASAAAMESMGPALMAGGGGSSSGGNSNTIKYVLIGIAIFLAIIFFFGILSSSSKISESLSDGIGLGSIVNGLGTCFGNCS